MLNLEIIYKCTRIQDCYPKDEQFSDKIIHLFTENLDLIKDSTSKKYDIEKFLLVLN
jgi:hypothetical protein